MPDIAYEKWLLEQLVGSGKLTREELADALEAQQQRGGPDRVQLNEILLERGLLSAADLEATWPNQSPGKVAASADASPASARRVGRFVIREELGRGGMGAVFRAYDPQLDREVAIKLIHVEAAKDGTEFYARFQREAQVIARLRHRGIVSIHEVGTHEGQPFIVMDMVEGTSLQELLSGGSPLSIRELAELFSQVADALHHAHGEGVVHRDIKPANIMVDHAGRALLVDFGVAWDLAASRSLTATGAVIGTLFFLAPEQAGAPGLGVGPHTDVYALGATIYRALTGRPPFVAENSVVVLKRILMDDPVPLRRLVATLPADLETIALKCLEKDPGRRYVSAAALADDLRRFLAGEPILARHRGPVERGFLWLRRSPGVVAAGVLGVVAVVAAGVALRAPAPGAATRRPRADAQAAREPLRRRELRSSVESDQAAVVATSGEAEAKSEELERESFFERLRDHGTMRNFLRKAEASNDLVWSVRVPAEMVGEDLSHLMALPGLKQVDLSASPFADAGMAFLRPLTQLIGLDLAGTQVTDEGLEHLEGMAGMKKLDLCNSQVTSAGLQHLQGLRSMAELRLNGTQVGDAGLVHLVGLESLEKLWLAGTQITDAGLGHLQALKMLEELRLGGTQVTDSGLVSLQGLKSLRELSLTGTGVTDAGLAHLLKVRQLRRVKVTDCPVTDAGVAFLESALPGCEVRR